MCYFEQLAAIYYLVCWFFLTCFLDADSCFQVSACLKCEGKGRIVTDNCQKCGGHGQIQSKRSIKVVVPPGVHDGATMQVRGEGNIDKKRSPLIKVPKSCELSRLPLISSKILML